MIPTLTPLERQYHNEHVARVAKIAARAVHDDGIDLRRGRGVAAEPPKSEPLPALLRKSETPPCHTLPRFIPISEPNPRGEVVLVGRKPPHRVIQMAVAQVAMMPLEVLLGRERFAKIVRVRHIAMYVSRICRSDSLPTIGRNYANRDHTTTLGAINKVRRRMPHDAAMVRMITDALDVMRAKGWMVPDGPEIMSQDKSTGAN